MPLIASLLHPFKIIEKNGAHTDQNMPQRRRDMGVERDFLDSQKPLQTVLGGVAGATVIETQANHPYSRVS